MQSRLGKSATNYLRKEFNVDINIEKVNLAFLGDVQLNEIFIRDHHLDTLIYAKNLTTSIFSYRNIINNKLANFYGGGIWYKEPYSNYYNSPNLKGTLYKSRRRFTEIEAKNKIHSPSPTFNCVGPGAVGTGSLAGMRVLNFL